jgi:hypothetical protein
VIPCDTIEYLMANSNDTVSIKISLSTYASLKKIADEKRYTYGGFADVAIMERIERIRALDKLLEKKQNQLKSK